MRIPTLPKHWKVEERCAYRRYSDGTTYTSPYQCQVLLNPKGETVLVFWPSYDFKYEETRVEALTELEFLKRYAWEPKP
jgi:hypothetical protein